MLFISSYIRKYYWVFNEKGKRGWAKTSFKIKPHNDFSLENNQDDKITVWFLSV